MSSLQKKSGISTRSVKKVAHKAVKGASSALVVAARRVQPSRRVVKHAKATLRTLPGRTRSFVKRNPVRVLFGAWAIGFVLAKLRHLV